MSDQFHERRRGPRCVIGVPAVLRRTQGGEGYEAVTTDVLSSGLLFELTDTNPFAPGDPVVCEVALPDFPDQALPAWGQGRVVRVEQLVAAVEMETGVFAPGTGMA